MLPSFILTLKSRLPGRNLLLKSSNRNATFSKYFSQLNVKGHSMSETIVHASLVKRAKIFAKVAVLNVCF